AYPPTAWRCDQPTAPITDASTRPPVNHTSPTIRPRPTPPSPARHPTCSSPSGVATPPPPSPATRPPWPPGNKPSTANQQRHDPAVTPSRNVTFWTVPARRVHNDRHGNAA